MVCRFATFGMEKSRTEIEQSFFWPSFLALQDQACSTASQSDVGARLRKEARDPSFNQSQSSEAMTSCRIPMLRRCMPQEFIVTDSSNEANPPRNQQRNTRCYCIGEAVQSHSRPLVSWDGSPMRLVFSVSDASCPSPDCIMSKVAPWHTSKASVAQIADRPAS